MEDAPPHTANMRFRDYKQFFDGGVYHIYNRGHNKMMVFRDAEDYRFFMQRLEEILSLQPPKSRWLTPLPKGSFSILSYCLMPNHFHFLVRQETELTVSKLIGKISTSYGIYFNKKYGQVGGIFQDQFKAKEVSDDEYLTHLSGYIHKNPAKPFAWPYSSLSTYLGEKEDLLIDSTLILNMFGNDHSRYRQFIKDYGKANEILISDLIFDD